MQTRLGTAAPELLHFPNLTQWLKVGIMMRMRMRMRMNGMTDGSDVYIEYGDDDNAGGRGLSRDR